MAKMEEYFVQKCVTSDAMPGAPEAISTYATLNRCECVIVQESAHANGASRAIVASILAMTIASKKTTRVLLFTLEPSHLLQSGLQQKSEKLVVADYSSDWDSLSDSAADASQCKLLTKMQDKLLEILASTESNSSSPCASARPTVVVIDSLNVLLEKYPLAAILTWLRLLRRDPRVGSVVYRLNAAATTTGSVAQTLARHATAVVQVETKSSLLGYAMFAKERRREIPKQLHGMVLLLRKKKNGKTSESVEFFHVSNGKVVYSDAASDMIQEIPASSSASTPTVPTTGTNGTTPPPEISSSSSVDPPRKALPVRAEEVSFNLSISREEEAARRNVQLPYMHQGGGGGGSSMMADSHNNLIFIDDDDPDWDDDDLDDDLDI